MCAMFGDWGCGESVCWLQLPSHMHMKCVFFSAVGFLKLHWPVYAQNVRSFLRRACCVFILFHFQ
jgi:hypothetical protein